MSRPNCVASCSPRVPPIRTAGTFKVTATTRTKKRQGSRRSRRGSARRKQLSVIVNSSSGLARRSAAVGVVSPRSERSETILLILYCSPRADDESLTPRPRRHTLETPLLDSMPEFGSSQGSVRGKFGIDQIWVKRCWLGVIEPQQERARQLLQQQRTVGYRPIYLDIRMTRDPWPPNSAIIIGTVRIAHETGTGERCQGRRRVRRLPETLIFGGF